MIITVTLNPALDKTITIPSFAIDRVNRVTSGRMDPGGKGINVSKVIHSLGGESVAIAVVGGAAGEYIRDQLDDMGIRNDCAFVRAQTRTNLKIVDPDHQTNTDLNEPGAALQMQTLKEVWDKIDDHVNPGDTVVLAGKNPPGVPDDLLAEWVTKLRQQDVKVALDTVGTAMKIGVAAGPTLIKPNDAELSELCETELDTVAQLLAAAQKVVDNGVEYVIVSMGEDGALFVGRDLALHAHGIQVPVGSTVGAGDAMMASIVLDLERGLDWEQIAARAVATSAAKVMCNGSQAPTPAEIEPLIAQVRIDHLI